MNVLHENARFSRALGRGQRGRGRRNVPAQLAKNPLPKYRFDCGEPKPLVNLAPSTANTTRTPKNRQRAATSSSSARKGTSSSNAATTKTPGSSCISDDTNIILAITAGRGDARTEVGMAAIDLQYPYMILCQISDSQTYIDTLTKIYVFNPVEIIMPDTMCDRQNKLYSSIKERFRGRNISPISRFHFNDKAGLDRIQKHCCVEYSSVVVFVKQKYYALAATSALLKYVEYIQHIVYAPKSMRIEFQGSPHCAVIDVESAEKLELVVSQGNDPKICLLGALDHCLTPMGRRLLRVSILQPPCREETIIERQRSVSELLTNPSLCSVIQPAIRRLYGADRLLNMGILHLHTSTVQNAERNLNYILLLKNCLDVVPELRAALNSGDSPFFEKVRTNLDNPEFEMMRDKILKVIHQDARSVMGYTSANMQRCFAIRTGVNDLLDVARRTYCELIEEMKTMVEDFGKRYNLPMTLACNATLGYHIQADVFRCRQIKETDFPQEFIQVQRRKNYFTMTTIGLLAMSNQCKMSYDEIHIMSDVVLTNLLADIKEHIAFLFQLSSDVAELDLIVSLTQVSSMPGFVKPTFGMKLELQESMHPIMKMFKTTSNVIANNVRASIPYNLHLITGPNMSGKSVYIKQVVLTQIMAQIGCYVLATKAEFRIADRILCRICFHDDIECQASTFTLEMKEAQHILQSVTPNSLLVLDEPCRATAIEQGSSIAVGICEKLFSTTAFIFCATHFVCLSELADMYFNVTNHCFKVITEVIEGSDTPRILYTHKLVIGDAPNHNYGISLAIMSGLPKVISTKAYAIIDILRSERNCADKEAGRKKKEIVASLKLRYDLFAGFFLNRTKDRFNHSSAMDLITHLHINIIDEREKARNFKRRIAEIVRPKNDVTTTNIEKSLSQNVPKYHVPMSPKLKPKIDLENCDKGNPRIKLESQNRPNQCRLDTNMESKLIGTLKKHVTLMISQTQRSQEMGAEKIKRAMTKRAHKIEKMNATSAEFPKSSDTDSFPQKIPQCLYPNVDITENPCELISECPQNMTPCNFTGLSPSLNNIRESLLHSVGSVGQFSKIPSKSDSIKIAQSKHLEADSIRTQSRMISQSPKITVHNLENMWTMGNHAENESFKQSQQVTSNLLEESPAKRIKSSFNLKDVTTHCNENSYAINNNICDESIAIPVNQKEENSVILNMVNQFETKPYVSSSIANTSWLQRRINPGSISTSSKAPSSTTSGTVVLSSKASSPSYLDLEILKAPLGVSNKPCAVEKPRPTKLDFARPRTSENRENLTQRYSSLKNSMQDTTLSVSKVPQSMFQETCQSLIRVSQPIKMSQKNQQQFENMCKSTFNFTPTNSFQNTSRNLFENSTFEAMSENKLHNMAGSTFKITPTNAWENFPTNGYKTESEKSFLQQNSTLHISKLSPNTLGTEPENSVIIIPSYETQKKRNDMCKNVFKTASECKTRETSESTFKMTPINSTMNNSQIKYLTGVDGVFKNSSQTHTIALQNTFEDFSQKSCKPVNEVPTGKNQCQFQLFSEKNTNSQKDHGPLFDIARTPSLLKTMKKEYDLSSTSSNESYIVSPHFFEANISKMKTVSDLTLIFGNDSISGQSNSTEIAKYTARAKEIEIFRKIEGDAFDEEQFRNMYNTVEISDEDN